MALNNVSDTILTGGNLWLPSTSYQMLENDYYSGGSASEMLFTEQTIARVVGTGIWGTAVTFDFRMPAWSADATLNENLRLHIQVEIEHKYVTTSGGYSFRLHDGTNTGSPVTPTSTLSYQWQVVSLVLTPSDTWPSGQTDIELQYDWGGGIGPDARIRRSRAGRLTCGWYVYEV